VSIFFSGELLRSLNDSFSLIIDENEFVPPQMFQVTKPNNAKSNVFRELMFIYDFIQKTLVLKLTKFLEDDEDDTCVIDISKFRNLTTIEFQRIDIQRVVGLQLLRSQLQEITAERCLKNIKDLLMHCAGDNSNSFIWNSLKRADFSYNNLERIDNSFEFAPYIQHLNLSHNKIFQISALVWLPNLKNLNLSYNQLTSIPKLNVESLKRLQVLTINANLIEDLSGIIRLDALLELDLADNCLLDHQILLPLCTLNSLRYLNLSGNPLAFHPKHRSATCRYLSRNASQVQFQLDGEFLSKTEKSLSGSYENYFPLFGSRMTMSTTSSRATPSTKSRCDTPNSSLSSVNSFNITEQRTTSSQKRMRPRCVEIEESESKNNKSKLESNKRPLLKEGSKDHLITKIEIEKMREQFGNDWLHNHEDQNDAEKGTRRRLFEDIIAMSPTGSADDATIINDSNVGNETVYKTAEGSMYASALEESVESLHHEEEEPVILSDPEDNEAQFIVVDVFSKEDLFLIVTDNCIKERDAMTMRTLTKWGISTLESVERPRTCIIRLTFDTIRKDKRERQYEMEAKPCQQLERLLRDYLSTKPLSEMNQTVYKCLKCNSEFCREVVDDRKRRDNGKKLKFQLFLNF
jgi:Leucine-rich repeat (LRR) protein